MSATEPICFPSEMEQAPDPPKQLILSPAREEEKEDKDEDEEEKEEKEKEKEGEREKKQIGRIMIYTITGCPYCRRAKSFLSEELGLEYQEINLDLHGHRREEMYQRTARRTVPQIFFNEVHVGGCDDLFAKSPSDLRALITLLDSPPPPSAPQPSPPLPSSSSCTSSSSPASTSSSQLLLPNDFISPPDDHSLSSSSSSSLNFEISCETDTFINLIDAMMNPKTGVQTKDRTYHMRRYRSCFVGRSAVDWLVVNGYADNRETAVALGNQLFERMFFHHVTYDHNFKDEKLFYRFLSHKKTKALNTDSSSVCEPEDPSKLSENIRRVILSIYDQFLSSDGLQVDYAGIASSLEFQRFRNMTTQLQRVNLNSMSRNEKLAFFINIYNALVIHANVAQGPPKNSLQRSKFFNSVSYLIGGLEFSLNDIENGVLRGNRRAPFGFFKPFSKSDPRFAVKLEYHEPRIHFALVCGAKSCPPIKTYQASAVDEQLTAAAQGFFECTDNLDVNEAKRTVYLSKILDWYSVDFGRNQTELLSWIVSFAPPSKAAQLQNLLASRSSINVEFRTYDWSMNSKSD